MLKSFDLQTKANDVINLTADIKKFVEESGIQSGAAPFIDHIEGSLDTVIGLPVKRLLSEFPDLAGGN